MTREDISRATELARTCMASNYRACGTMSHGRGFYRVLGYPCPLAAYILMRCGDPQ